MSKRILVVEDDPTLSQVLRDNLLYEGFDVICIDDGRRVMASFAQFPPDLVVLDLTLPGVDGLEICGRLRETSQVPVLMLTARVQKSDKLRGLELGADDYITKPFDLDEFLARVKAVLRRSRPACDELKLGSLVIDFVSRTARRDRVDAYLTQREFELLHYLANRTGRVVHRNELLRDVWHQPESVFTRCVDNAVARLRKKIEPDVDHPRFIHTVHGDGYVLTPEGRNQP